MSKDELIMPIDGCGCMHDAAGRLFRSRCICPPESTPEQTLRAVAGLGGAIGDAVAGLLAEVETLRSRAVEPRVWLPGDLIPGHACYVDRHGCVDQDTEDDTPWTHAAPLVEVLVPDFNAAVAAERARRGLSAATAPAEAGSGNGAGEARTAVSSDLGPVPGPSEGEASDR
jgi:hypothetical protein